MFLLFIVIPARWRKW